LLHVNTPEVSENVRLETGFIQGDEVSVHYDPMIAKLVVRGEDRNDALRVLKRALDTYNVSMG
jgi:3-methylcrotonyl-CoA carboxylase alpha subunit